MPSRPPCVIFGTLELCGWTHPDLPSSPSGEIHRDATTRAPACGGSRYSSSVSSAASGLLPSDAPYGPGFRNRWRHFFPIRRTNGGTFGFAARQSHVGCPATPTRLGGLEVFHRFF